MTKMRTGSTTSAVFKRGLAGILWLVALVGANSDSMVAVQSEDDAHRHLKSPSIGEYRALVVLMRFTDHTDRTLPEPSYFQSLCDGDDAISAARFFRGQSGNQYAIDCEVTQWIDTDNTEEFYSYGNSGLVQGSQAHDMFRPVMDQVEAQQIDKYGSDWFQRYDRDGDGSFDAIIFIHSGHGTLFQCGPDDTSSLNRIAAKGYPNSQGGWVSQEFLENSIRVRGYAVASAFHDNQCDEPLTVGRLVHEWIHTFTGIPELNDWSVFTSTFGVAPGGIGNYGIMTTPRDEDSYRDAPGSMSPWVLNELGWATITEITADGIYNISDSTDDISFYRINEGYADGEYLLIENRQKVRVDRQAAGSGILIWHIDENVDTNNQETSYPGASDGQWPALHYKVALVQADGQFDLEKGVNGMDANDYWNQQDQTLTPSTGLDGSQQGVEPNSDSYTLGPTGVAIRILSHGSNENMEFYVAGITGSGFPTPTAEPSSAPSSNPSSVPTSTPSSTPSSSPTATQVSGGASETVGATSAAPDTTTETGPAQGASDSINTSIETNPTTSAAGGSPSPGDGAGDATQLRGGESQIVTTSKGRSSMMTAGLLGVGGTALAAALVGMAVVYWAFKDGVVQKNATGSATTNCKHEPVRQNAEFT